MRVLIIGNGNLFLMPYLRHYVDVLESESIDYDLVYWDRVDKIETDRSNYIRFVQKKASGIGIKSIPGYLKYYKFVKPLLTPDKYDFCIVFTVQLAILFRSFLRNIPYILDIRDYTSEHLSVYRYLEKQVVDAAVMNTISSEGDLEWLPKGRSYAMCKNVSFDTEMENIAPFNTETRNISYIGTIRYLKGNIDFLEACANIKDLEMHYYGRSDVGKQIAEYCSAHQINNVIMHGMFQDSELHELYGQANFIHSVYGTETMNERCLLPNRLFGACALKRPIIVSSGTHLADVVAKYGLGIIFDANDVDGFRSQLEWYYIPENYTRFCDNCEAYLALVNREMEQFLVQLRAVLRQYMK